LKSSGLQGQRKRRSTLAALIVSEAKDVPSVWKAPIFFYIILAVYSFHLTPLQMCAQAEHFDDIKCENAPPSYDAVSVFTLSRLKDPAEKRAAVLSLIHAIVSTTPPSFAPIDIAATLPAAEFSDLLQSPNIEGHTAMYWAIVNNRKEAFSAWAKFISELSSDCVSDLRLACMVTSDHGLFTELHLGNTDRKCTIMLT